VNLLALVVWSISAGCATTPPSAPDQPRTGFGSKDYPYSDVEKLVFKEEESLFYIFYPKQNSVPQTARFPVVVFLHGWLAKDPQWYGAWIEHLVRRGAVVIWPEYQPSWVSMPTRFTGNTMDSVKKAFRYLRDHPSIPGDLDRLAIVGHSSGGILAANYAALAGEHGLPKPHAVFAVHPGNTWIRVRGNHVPLEDMSSLPKESLLLVLIGDDDRVALARDGKEIYQNAAHLPTNRKNLVLFQTDDHGRPEIRSDHLAPLAKDNAYSSAVIEKNALIEDDERNRQVEPTDYLIYWRILDALIAVDRSTVGLPDIFGDYSDFDVGCWDDGKRIRALKRLR